ncbi:MAG: 4-carboxy muconolactone decarboxylase [Ferrovum sp. 34-44-207]|nr:MAG: 4-carboxy muconolactone decarboxylase [Ferrovum sp. 34-44-207]
MCNTYRNLCTVLCLFALPIDPNHYSLEEQEAKKIFEHTRKTPIFGPFEPLLYSPKLMNEASSMGEYLRYHSAIGHSLSELVILITARFWTQDYEWYVHSPIAQKKGIPEEVIAAIRLGRIPSHLSADQQIIYNFSTELLNNKQVSDDTYDLVEKRFGQQGAVDLTGIIGYYSLLALEMNMAQYPLPKNGTPLPRLPDIHQK